MKLGYTILYVEDVKKSLAFYQQAFNLDIKFLHDSHDYGELDTGNTTLSFSSRNLMKSLNKNPSTPNAHAPSFEIAFIVDDVAQTLEKALASGAKLIQNVEQMPWGQNTAYITDPDGFLVEICTAVSS
ncbi:VOC family protein [Neisseria sp. Ec49-e6-T10]|uniref:VOC family protein n=1 Tax=Neisseria sp. Ec49-e6-T10 TaxID=3140744 RepID=UPI003EC097AC